MAKRKRTEEQTNVGGRISYLRYFVICVCLRIVVFNTYRVVLTDIVLCSSSWLLYVASFSGLFFSDCPFGIL